MGYNIAVDDSGWGQVNPASGAGYDSRQSNRAALQQHVRDSPEAHLVNLDRHFTVDPSAISYSNPQEGADRQGA